MATSATSKNFEERFSNFCGAFRGRNPGLTSSSQVGIALPKDQKNFTKEIGLHQKKRPLRKPLNWPPKHIPWYLCVVIDALWLYLIKADCPWFLCISVMIISLMARIFGSGFPLTASYRKGRFLWNGSKRMKCHGLMCHFGNIGRIEGGNQKWNLRNFSKDLYHPKGGQRLARRWSKNADGETDSSHLKIGGWNNTFPVWEPLFSGATLVFGSVSTKGLVGRWKVL